MTEKKQLLTLQLLKSGSIDKKNLFIKIQQKLKTPAPSKYVNPNLINDFVDFLIKHIFEENIIKETEEFIQTINIPLLYSIYVIKSKVNPNFDISNIDDKKFKENIEEIFNNINPSFNKNYQNHYFDIYRYLILYNKILTDTDNTK
ncbi:hypothetical protein H8356DRAFT_1379848 [Neocallimastix lanati (nom. inval.)]|nr:hypothetical protein H8356DRAFT_1379848 [Neocallimastix sp. JGI-2020a]